MPDIITPQERALIDAAIAAGKVRHIPVGTSVTIDYSWNGRHRRLERANKEDAKPKPPGYGLMRVNAERRKSGELRKQAILEMARGGMRAPQIAERVNILRHRVNEILRELRAEGKLE